MPDPAAIIAGVITRPPEHAGMGGPLWQYQSAMSMPGGPDLAAHIAGAAIQALTDAGWAIVPGWKPAPAALPSASQVRSWLREHQWTAGLPGKAGCLWLPPSDGDAVAVPDDDGDPDAVAGAIRRIAARSGCMAGAAAREMRQYPRE